MGISDTIEVMELNRKITDHVTYGEVIRSTWAKRNEVSNEPTFGRLWKDESEFVLKAKILCEVYEKIRSGLGVPIFISSMYRSPLVNNGVGGSANSQHIRLEAMDLDADVFAPTLGDKAITNKELFLWCKGNMEFDQLLWEGGVNGWVHISHKASGNRMYVGEIPNPHKI